MATKTITSEVTSVEVKKFDSQAYSRNPMTELYDIKLLIHLSDGHWFYTPATRMSITSAPGAAVMITHENDWITGGDGLLKPGEKNTVYPESKISVGDTITVRGQTDGKRLLRVQLKENPEIIPVSEVLAVYSAWALNAEGQPCGFKLHMRNIAEVLEYLDRHAPDVTVVDYDIWAVLRSGYKDDGNWTSCVYPNRYDVADGIGEDHVASDISGYRFSFVLAGSSDVYTHHVSAYDILDAIAMFERNMRANDVPAEIVDFSIL